MPSLVVLIRSCLLLAYIVFFMNIILLPVLVKHEYCVLWHGWLSDKNGIWFV